MSTAGDSIKLETKIAHIQLNLWRLRSVIIREYYSAHCQRLLHLTFTFDKTSVSKTLKVRLKPEHEQSDKLWLI